MIFTKVWWRSALIRAGKTAAQTAIAMLPAAITITAVDWLTTIGSSVLAALVSLLMSLAGLPEVDGRTMPWWKAMLIRAVKTMAQTVVGLIPAAATITDVRWRAVLGTAGLAGLISVLTSLAGLPEAEE